MRLRTSKCQIEHFLFKKAKFTTFLTLSVISGNSEIATMEYQNKNFSSYSIGIKSVWLWFPASPWLNLWLIFLKSLKNSSRDLYNSFCGLESFKKCPSQGRVGCNKTAMVSNLLRKKPQSCCNEILMLYWCLFHSSLSSVLLNKPLPPWPMT